MMRISAIAKAIRLFQMLQPLFGIGQPLLDRRQD